MFDIRPDFFYYPSHLFYCGIFIMKNLTLIVIIFLSFLAFPAGGDASYLILLRNGGKLATPRYWSEGNQIKFYIYGGIVGIKKDSVRKIEKSASENMIYVKSQVRQKTTEEVSEISSKTNDREIEDSRAEGESIEKTGEKPDIDYYKEKKSLLKAELDRTLDRLREATKDRDPEAKKKAREEMRKISTEIYDLTDELKEKNNGKLPEGWWEEK